jgi:hypothetical protein
LSGARGAAQHTADVVTMLKAFDSQKSKKGDARRIHVQCHIEYSLTGKVRPQRRLGSEALRGARPPQIMQSR